MARFGPHRHGHPRCRRRDRRAVFLTVADRARQGVGDFIESVVPMAVHHIVHRAIMGRAERFRGLFEPTSYSAPESTWRTARLPQPSPVVVAAFGSEHA